jgi:hypothetical protein
MTDKQSVYAIVRLDDIKVDSINLIDAVSVTSILPTQDDAEREVLRLNELNKETGSRYHWFQTRYYPGGKNLID